MSTHTPHGPRWSRIVAAGVLGAGLTWSMTAGTVSAFADPADPATPTTPAPAPGTPGLQLSGGAAGGTPMAGARPAAGAAAPTAVPSYATVLDRLAQEFSRGAGAGKVANLLNDALTLREQGLRPRPADLMAVQASLDKRPNQGPLIEALSTLVANQRKLQSQMGGSSGQQPMGPVGIGINQGDWMPGNPMIQDDPIFPMPGRN